ncbi:MAG: META domain-containing protein [Actinomycetota bacterium]
MRRLIVSIVLLLAACGRTADDGLPRQGSDAGSIAPYEGAWKLTSRRESDGQVPLIENYPITLTIAAGTIGGTAACNHYGADVTVDGSTFAIGDLSMTEMGCAPPVMRSEAAYLSSLSQVDSVARDEDTLTLTGRHIELSFELLPPLPAALLVDVTWRLESLIEGRGPTGTAMSADPATLVLGADGALRGSTGCRSLRGEWIERGEQIVVPELSASGQCSEDRVAQDAHVVEVLGDGFTAVVEGRKLTIFSARGGRGLVYRAR